MSDAGTSKPSVVIVGGGFRRGWVRQAACRAEVPTMSEHHAERLQKPRRTGNGHPHRDQRRLRRRARPRHRPGDLPGGQHDLHRPRRVRPLEQPVRRDVPSSGRSPRSPARCSALGWPAASDPSASTWPAWRPDSSPWCCSSLSTLFTDEQPVAYTMLLVATAFLGAGFGLTVPTLNTLTAVFHPAAVDRSVLALNALLGLGTALAPLFVAMFVGLGFWWGSAGAVVRPARRPAVRQPPPAAAVRRPRGRGRHPARDDRHPQPLLDLRRLRRALRHLRDDERQLVPARHDHRARRLDNHRLDRPHHVLGDGHRRAGRLRLDPALVSDPPDLPCAAVRSRRRVRDHRLVVGQAARRPECWRSGWPVSGARRCCRSPSASPRRTSWPCPQRRRAW